MEPDRLVRVDPAAMQKFAAALEGAAEDLRSRLSQLDDQVAEMVAGWHGGAGSAYRSAWQRWHRGAVEVQQGLTLMARAAGLAGLDFASNESASAATVQRLGDV
ncbi:WXG100 family type VII secretion target [Mycobacterium sp.]|uniref:WXG100 family type VII secretion target n=1 Tax=Mycobacterium sp. TaxID=1785 RepID=UPI0025CD48A0|nr:WXG100 family type VII secretion target [Mycobacterium sp.]